MAVGHVDYFDRYFAFGVHSDDWSDVELADDLELLAESAKGEHADRIAHYLRTDAWSAVRKMDARTGTLATMPARPLLLLLAMHYRDLQPAPGLFDNASYNTYISFATDLLFRHLPTAHWADTLGQMAESGIGGLELVLHVVTRVTPTSTWSEQLNQLLGHGAPAITSHIPGALEELRNIGPPAELDLVALLLVKWHQIAPDADIAAWSQQYLVGSCEEELLDLVALIMTTVYSQTAFDGGPPQQLIDLRDRIEVIFGLDWLKDRLATRPPADFTDIAEESSEWKRERAHALITMQAP